MVNARTVKINVRNLHVKFPGKMNKSSGLLAGERQVLAYNSWNWDYDNIGPTCGATFDKCHTVAEHSWQWHGDLFQTHTVHT